MRNTTLTSPVIAHRASRERAAAERKLFLAKDKAATAAHAEVSEYGTTDPGRLLRKSYEDRHDATLARWLSLSPLSPEFPASSIAVHAELSAYQCLITDLTPAAVLAAPSEEPNDD